MQKTHKSLRIFPNAAAFDSFWGPPNRARPQRKNPLWKARVPRTQMVVRRDASKKGPRLREKSRGQAQQTSQKIGSVSKSRETLLCEACQLKFDNTIAIITMETSCGCVLFPHFLRWHGRRHTCRVTLEFISGPCRSIPSANGQIVRTIA